VPLYLIARRRLGGHTIPCLLSICYLLYPAIQGANIRDFHEIPLATPLLLFLLLMLETGQKRLFWISLVLTLMVKEDLALSCFALGVYAAISRKNVRVGILTCFVCALYFALCVGVIMPMNDGSPMASRFEGYIAPGFTGLKGMLATLLTNPFFTLYFAFFDANKILFLLQMLGPILFLPLIAGNGLVLLAPGFATALLASDGLHYTIGLHYPATLAPFVFYLTILALERIRPSLRLKLAGLLIVSSLLFNYEFGWFFSKRFTGFEYPRQQYDLFREITKSIPDSAGVSASNPLIPHLSRRERIYYFPFVGDSDYIVFCTASVGNNFWPETRESSFDAIISIVRRGVFGVVRFEGDFLLLRRGAPANRNPEAVHRLLAIKIQH
ncbi:MAG TPA: DUF2079 domain-containing protein, partial [bacterium]|nr:DUF2079 domain-containing protein [bacterium]